MSIPCRVVTGVLVCVGAVGCLLVPLLEGWWWLDLLYLLSYVKLIISSIKYVPQVSVCVCVCVCVSDFNFFFSIIIFWGCDFIYLVFS